MICATGIAVPERHRQERPGQLRGAELRREQPPEPPAQARTARPNEGKIAVRPVLAIIRPVNSEPTAMPAVIGSISSPVSRRLAPRTT